MPVDYTFRHGALPGVLQTSHPFGQSYATLTGSDGGISEAVRIYWATKSLSVSVSADASFSNGSPVVFTHDAEYPGDTGTFYSYEVSGFIGGSDIGLMPNPTIYVEPPFRPKRDVGQSAPFFLFGESLIAISPTFPEEANDVSLYIEIRYVGGQYRMYPSLIIRGSNQVPPATPRRLNRVSFEIGVTPTGDPNTDSQIGTVDILGYSFDYVCEARCSDTAGTATLNSQSLTITSASW